MLVYYRREREVGVSRHHVLTGRKHGRKEGRLIDAQYRVKKVEYNEMVS